MLKLVPVVVALLAFPAAAQAQREWPEAWIGDRLLSRGSGCIAWPTPGTPAVTGICGDAPAPNLRDLPPLPAAPGSTLTLRFSDPVERLSGGENAGTLTRVDATSWTYTLAPRAVGPNLIGFWAKFAGPRVTGDAAFNGHLAVTSQTVTDLRRTGSVVRARVRVPAQGTVRAYVRVNGKRRSAVVTRTFAAADARRLRLTVQRPGTAWLVTQYTFPGAKPVEVSQRLTS